jgi:hypothetical protein
LNDKDYEHRLRQRVGEGEYARHKELVRLLARNLALEDILWEEISLHIRDVNLRTELLRQRNAVVKDIHTEFRALNIEIPSVIEQKTVGFTSFLEDLTDDDSSEKRDEVPEVNTDR